jgi:DEAD_2
MADSDPHESNSMVRKRPLVGKENCEAPSSTSMKDSKNEKRTPVRDNPYASKKRRPIVLSYDGGGVADDVEVISPPPPQRFSVVAGASKPLLEEENSNNDDCAIAWSNASNPLVDYPHGRPDCGVHDFHHGDNKQKFCNKCYCVVCNTLASACTSWDTHCQEEKQKKHPLPRQEAPPDQQHAVIDIEDSSPQHQQQQAPTSRMAMDPLIQQYYASMGIGYDSDVIDNEDDSDHDDADDGDQAHAAMMMQQGRGNPKYNNHYTNGFNHAYDNRSSGPEKTRNPKTMRITEILAIKMAEALHLSDRPKKTAPPKSTQSSTRSAAAARDDPNNSNNKKTAGEDVAKTQQLQKKDRFNQCEMQGDIAQLNLHKSNFVEGVRIGWPFPSMLLPQRQMAIHLIKALKNSRHVVLESPTGTGKSAAILCSLLAWQRHHAKSHWGNNAVLDDASMVSNLAKGIMGLDSSDMQTFPRIIYCSRTHSQCAQMVASLKKTPYRPRMTVLGSRERLCIHRYDTLGILAFPLIVLRLTPLQYVSWFIISSHVTSIL